MTRLLQAMAGARHGGAEAFFTRLAIGLGQAGQDQKLVIRRDADRAAALRQAGLDVTELRFGARFDFLTRRAFAKAIRTYRPQVVLTWMSRATSLCPAGDFVHVARLGGYYDLKYYRRCDHLVGNTQDIVDYLIREGWPRDRAHYLPNFVKIVPAAPLDREELGASVNAPLALALGRLHPNKGFDTLLAAVAQVPDLRLWLAGEGDLRPDLERQARDLGIASRVRFLGWREDVSDLMATADMVVVPSRHEPLGNVVIEAWAAKAPVIATNSAGPAALIEAGETGILVPVDDAPALAAALRELAGNWGLRRSFAIKGFMAYQARFEESRVVATYREFIDRIAR